MATVTSSKRHLLVTSDTYTSNGDVTVGGDLFVNGSQTVINTATLNVEDKNISLNYGGTEASSQGSGITIVGSGATLIWDEANTRWAFSDSLVVTDHVKMTSGNASGKFAVKATDVHASYDFYNNGTSYFNDSVVIDANLTLSGGVDILMSDNSGAAVEFKQGTDLYMRFITTNGGEHIEVNKNMEIQGLTATAGTFSSTLSASNLSGTNTGDQDLSGLLPKSGGTVTGNLTVNGTAQLGNALSDKAIVHGHLGIGHESSPKIAYPGQNALWGEANNSTVGQVVIDVPGTLNNYDMLYIEIDMYEYNSTNATKLIIGGHNWNSGGDTGTSNLMWYNAGVKVIGSSTKSVYLGWRNDGTNNRRVIAIGETDSTWSYPTIHVSKIHGNDGYTSSMDLVGNWAINLTTSSSYFTKSPTTNFNAATSTTFTTRGNISANNFSGSSSGTNTGDQVLPTDFVSAANGGTFSGGLTISGSVNSGATDYGYYQSAGTNIILKGDSVGRSGIFFESEKDGTNINDPSDYGFIQFHSYGYDNTTGESNNLVIGVANDSTDKVILQAPYNGGVMIGYKGATSGTGLTLSEVIHANSSSYNNSNWNTAYTHSQATHAPTDAEKNVQADWNESTTTSDAYIKNKPTIPAAVTDFVSKANGGTFSGDVIVNGQLTLGNTSQDPKNIVISQISGDNSEKTSLMLDGNGVVVTRELGTGAFTSTPTDFVSAANGGTFADSINVHGNILLTGAATTDNKSRMIDFTGFDKEGTTDFSDRAYISHTENTGGHAGSVLVISSQNDSNDGIAFATHSSSLLKHNGYAIFTENHKPTWSEIDSKPSTFAPSAHNQAWDTITGTPTTLAGYGITDTIPSGSQLVRVLNNQNYAPSDGSSSGNNSTNRANYGMGLTIYEGYNTGTNRPFTYDTTAQFMSTTGQGFELAIDWVSPTNTPLKIRSLRDCCQGWNPWTNVWTEHNFTLGTGGGLDADKVDGKHAADFAPVNHNHDTRYVRLDINQTLGQAYNFNNSGNQFRGHLYYNSHDSNGNHYYHYRTGSTASSGTTVNFRQYYNASNYITHTWKATSASDAYFDFVGELRPNKIKCDGEISAIGDIKVGSTTDGAQRVLRLYSYSADSKHSTIKTTNGNLHIDSEDGHSLYLNYYEGASTNIYFGTGNGGYCGTVSSAGLLRMANDVVAYYSFSDRRLKTNIKTTENNLEKILSLNPVEYTWKEGPREGVKEIGLIAQEVEEVVPEVVRVQSRHHDEKSEGEEYKQVDYEHLVSTLIGAMQEQQKQIDELKAQMAACEERSCNCKK